MSAQKDYAGRTQCMGNAALTAGTTSTYTSLAVPLQTNGIMSTFAAKTAQATPTVDATTGLAFVNVPTGYVTVVTVGVVGGAIAASQGSIEKLADGVVELRPQFAALPDGFCAIGYVVVANTQAANGFVFGTTSFATAGVGDTWKSVGSMPSRPVAA